MKTDKDMETLSCPGGSHTSGTEWSMADRSRPLDILKQRQKNKHVKRGKKKLHDDMRVVIVFLNVLKSRKASKAKKPSKW